jgi:hypothetical protein
MLRTESTLSRKFTEVGKTVLSHFSSSQTYKMYISKEPFKITMIIKIRVFFKNDLYITLNACMAIFDEGFQNESISFIIIQFEEI